jgi:hypothetical protein
MPVRTYYWDFFGPRAQPTAEHFVEHLLGFLQENGLEGCETGMKSEGAGHAAAFCVTPEQHQGPIESALKPRRST